MAFFVAAVDVTVNGKDLGIYALEESFTKLLLESSKFREGPILKFLEDPIWDERLQRRTQSNFYDSSINLLDIDGERIYVRSKSGNTLNVTRGKDGAVPIDHVIGAQVKGIDFTTTSTSVGTMGVDSAVIPEGDDFGFDGTITDTTS